MIDRTDQPTERSSRGRPLKRPRSVYEPPSDFEDEDCGESLADSDEDEEEEEDDEDTDLSGFIAPDDEDESYVPSDEEDDSEASSSEEEEEQDPLLVTRDNLIDKLMKFSEAQGVDNEDEAEVLAQMIVAGYKFPFLSEVDQLKLFPFYKKKTAPPLDLVRSVFRL